MPANTFIWTKYTYICLQICLFGLNIHIFCLQIRLFGLNIRIFCLPISTVHVFDLKDILYFSCFQRMREIISVLSAGLTVLAAGSLKFMFSFCQYLPRDWQSVPLDCLSHRYGTLQKRSTGQMKYRWETLTSKLDMKTLIIWTKTLPREY